MSEDGGVTVNSESPPMLKNDNHVVSHLSLLKEREEDDIVELYDNLEHEIHEMMDGIRMDDIDEAKADLE